MGGITTNVIYIASSLAAGGQPATTPVDKSPTLTVTVSATNPGELPTPSAPRGYVIFDLPKPSGATSAPLLGDVIADEMKRSREDYARSAPVLDTPTQRDFSVGGVPAVSEPGELNDAVVAAHDARIALLRERIDSLKTAGNAAPDTQLRDLAVRLKRAEAARKLAMARIALGEKPRDCDPRGGLLPCNDDPPQTALDTAPRRAATKQIAPAGRTQLASKPRLAEPHRTRVRRTVMTARIAQPPQRAGIHRLPPATTRSVRYFTESTTRGITIRRAAFAKRATPAARAALQPHVAERLDRARHLLTVARRSLAATGDDRHYASPRLASLWQWPGSDNWSLASYPRRRV